MIVLIRADSVPEIVERDRLDRLSATTEGSLADMVLEPICRRADDEHVWVRVEALRSACEPVVGHDAFDATITHAESKGWVDPTGTFVRAHVDG